MKLRQKLAAILATSMVASLVPVVTMAASSNTLVKTETVVEEDTLTTSASLRVKFEDTDGTEEFYLTLTNADWADPKVSGNDDQEEAYKALTDTTDGLGMNVSGKTWTKTINVPAHDSVAAHSVDVEFYRQSDSTLRVVIESGLKEDDKVTFPLAFIATGGTASVALTSESSNSSTITEGSWTLMSTGENAASATVDTTEMKSFYDNGELAPIVLKESFVGSMRTDDMILKVELQDTNFEFINTSKMKAVGSYGFAALNSGDDDKIEDVDFYIDEDDKSVVYVHIPASALTTAKGSTNSLGRITLEGLNVDADEVDDIEIGDLTADISTVSRIYVDGDKATGDSSDTAVPTSDKAEAKLDDNLTDVKVAGIVNYSVYFKLEDDKTVDIVGGRDEQVKFRVYESTDDVFVNGRKVTVSLGNAGWFWIEKYDGSFAEYKDLLELDTVEDEDLISDIEIEWKDDAKAKAGTDYRASEITFTLNSDYKGGKDDEVMNVNDQVDWFEINPYIYIPANQNEKEYVDLVGSYRSEEFTSAKAVNIINPFTVTAEPTTLKVGLQDQKVGDIVIKETDAKMLMKGTATLNILQGSKGDIGLSVDTKGTLTVTEGSVKTDDFGNNAGDDHFDIARQSKAAATITISGMLVTADRTVPEGTYDLKISGSAIDEHEKEGVSVKEYIVIGTANTQDISAANGLEKGTATFTIGSTSYTKDGVAVTMDAAPYILDPGYTMVPVRYVAKAFGVAESDIMFGQGTVTIIAGNRTIGLTNGSNVAVVNGVNVTMDAPVVIKEGRTYAPISQIANILGISSAWDNDTKTATFTN